MKKAVDKQNNIQKCQKTYIKKTVYLSLLFLLRTNENISNIDKHFPLFWIIIIKISFNNSVID